MLSSQIPTDRLDSLAVEAAGRVFTEMVGETAPCIGNVSLLEGESGDLLGELDLNGSGFYSVSVDFFGDVSGRVSIVLPEAVATGFLLKLFDVPSLDWLGEEDPEEATRDALGELGNMLAGLVKGGMTKWFSRLSLGTPKVLSGRRLSIDNGRLGFRRQYLFSVFEGKALVEFSCE